MPGIPSAEELSELPHAGLAAQLAGAGRVIADQAAVIGQLRDRVEHMERRAGEGFLELLEAVVGQPV